MIKKKLKFLMFVENFIFDKNQSLNKFHIL